MIDPLAASSAIMLLNLPFESLGGICAKLLSTGDNNALILTCRRLHYTLNTDLYCYVVWSEARARKALLWAAFNGRDACMRSLLSHGADLKPDLDGNNMPVDSLTCAVQCGHIGVVKLLIDAGASVNSHGGLGDLPIIWAVSQGHAEVLSLSHGCFHTHRRRKLGDSACIRCLIWLRWDSQVASGKS
ncbi:hypothetical protein BDW59DRAFT_146835 [Aspergillus cavernicola]|uniref:Ankyrin repeat-containing domain protein n=1 Tax=Aspergillus cavernicola TaxID=176166 RepID=A0ABR4IAX2_9EURO